MLFAFHIFLLVDNVLTMYSTREMEGYPAGFMSDCPGSDKEAFISKKNLKYLNIFVQGARSDLKLIRNKYNFFQMKELANDPGLDFSKRTVMYVGGFLDSPSFIFALEIARAYRDLEYNVLLLDTNTFTTMDYPRAARYMRPVGKNTAKMLSQLTYYGLDPKKFEIVGLSLGAQTASFIAKNYRDLTNTNVSRLTGLDPAGPCFRRLGPKQRIDKSDADFVDIIDTNIDGFGMAAPVGHVNFYVNGGEFQPDSFISMLCSTICSHIRSFLIWLSALRNPESFVAIQCDSVQQARDGNCYNRTPLVTNLLGLNINKDKEGIFYLATGYEYPYYLGEKGLTKEHALYRSMVKYVKEKSIVQMKDYK